MDPAMVNNFHLSNTSTAVHWRDFFRADQMADTVSIHRRWYEIAPEMKLGCVKLFRRLIRH